MGYNIHWAGDSTVKFNLIHTYPQTGIGQAMLLYLKEGIRLFNYAENGRSTKSFIEEGRLQTIADNLKKGDFLFIQFGHNDQKEDVERRTEPFLEFQTNLKKFIDTARQHGAHAVLITPLYRRHYEEHGVLMEFVHQRFPEAMLDLAVKEMVPCIDLCGKSKKKLEECGEETTKSWFMNLEPMEFDNYKEGSVDDTHLQYKGAVIMAGLVAEGLRELGGIYRELIDEEL